VTTRRLDVNPLVALACPPHSDHESTHRLLEHAGRATSATCPLTLLAFVRISSNPRIVTDAVTARNGATLTNAARQPRPALCLSKGIRLTPKTSSARTDQRTVYPRASRHACCART
jgi:predicted nucleic acid-binding protein